MLHAVYAIGAPGGGDMVTHTLDLTSMQFGEFGRGYAKETFRLGTYDEMHDGLERFCGGAELAKGMSQKIGSSGDPKWDRWMEQIARKVRQRWDKRETVKWCDYCGKPDPKSRCGICK